MVRSVGVKRGRKEMELGFVGTGNMGNPMALHLIEAGHALRVCDLRPEATASLEAAGARRVGTPAEAARGAAAVFLSLPKPADVEQGFAHARSFGSKASRSPSPRKFRLKSVAARKPLGASSSHQ